MSVSGISVQLRTTNQAGGEKKLHISLQFSSLLSKTIAERLLLIVYLKFGLLTCVCGQSAVGQKIPKFMKLKGIEFGILVN